MSKHKGSGSAPKMTIEQDEQSMADVATDEEGTSQGWRASEGAPSEETQRKKPMTRIDLEDAVGFIQGLGASAWVYAANHPYTVGYSFIGLVLAILILTIGFWSTVIIAVFVLVGAMIGQIRDGDNGIVNFFSGFINGRRP